MALINIDTNVIFIHIPRTAGNSMSKASFVNGYGRHEGARRVKWFMDHHIKGMKYWEAYKFAFVRNPWDRLVSAYFFEKHKMRRRPMWPDSFGEFVDFIYKNRKWLGETVLKSQHNYVCRSGFDKILNFIGRFENIEEDWKKVCKGAGFPYEPLIHDNKSKHRHYKDYYTPETIEKVAALYKKDIELFGYTY